MNGSGRRILKTTGRSANYLFEITVALIFKVYIIFYLFYCLQWFGETPKLHQLDRIVWLHRRT